MNFKHWLLQIGKSERSASSYSGAVSGVISNWANEAGLIQDNLSDIQSIKEFIVLTDAIKQLELFKQRDTKGKGMYSAALNHYAAYIDDVFGRRLKMILKLFSSTMQLLLLKNLSWLRLVLVRVAFVTV